LELEEFDLGGVCLGMGSPKERAEG